LDRLQGRQKRNDWKKAMLTYQITGYDTDTHEFCVRLTIENVDGGELRLTMPAWIPGSYMIRDFARNIVALTASANGRELSTRKHDKQTWVLEVPKGDVIVDYKVYAFDLSVRAAFLDRSRAYFNGTCLFLATNQPDVDWRVILPRPEYDWRVATTLPAEEIDDDGFGSYSGQGMETLYDCPVEMAMFEALEFTVAGIPHKMVVSEGGRFDKARIALDLAEICAEHRSMFGELPVERYLFMTLATAEGYGGLEHRDSTSLICRRNDLPRPGEDRPTSEYQQFLGLCSHEYFHLWNVKRIRPQRFIEGGLEAEVYTELLWAFEGITSYYDDLALVRSGVITTDDYLSLMAKTVTRVMRTAGRSVQSIAESSFDAWTKFYKQDENGPNVIVSYYAKGAVVAFGLDITLRRLSDNRVSLDDLMRALWERYGRAGIGVPERGIEQIAESLVEKPLAEFFAAYVYGTEELPLADWFGAVGVGCRLRSTKGPEDRGGCQSEISLVPAVPTLGALFEAGAEGLRLTHVPRAGAAEEAGLAAGDVIIALDGQRVTAANLQDLLQRQTAATQVHYFRRGMLRSAQLSVRPGPPDTCDLWLMPAEATDAAALVMRADWLRSRQNGRT
jgi:predicted metalloprotease with PDZ domain